MTLLTKEYPAQTRGRNRWIIEAVRANQEAVGEILANLSDPDKEGVRLTHSQFLLEAMHKLDRDALLQPGGILTSQQIEALR